MRARTVPVFCQACKAISLHLLATCTVTCEGCGEARTVDPEILAVASAMAAQPVEDMEFCRWCRVTKPLVHDCAGDPTPCPDRRPDGSTCGMCRVCVPTQEEYLKRAAEVADLQRYGTPGDLADTP